MSGSTVDMQSVAPSIAAIADAATYKTSKASRASIIVGFGLVYVIWGSTYLAIAVAVQTVPPLLMAGVRFLIAGSLLYGWQRYRGAPRPSLRDWRTAAIVGTCLIFAGNGALTYAEQYISSGLAAILIAVVPMFIVLLSWLSGASERPRPLVWFGIIIATLGVVVIVRPGLANSSNHHEALGVILALAGALAWSFGSVYASRVAQLASPFMMSAAQMISASLLLLTTAVLTGELGRVHPSMTSGASIGAFVYLILAGSIIGFTAYAWLLRNVEPTRVATYAYVNPVVAVLLGHFVAREEVTLTLFVRKFFRHRRCCVDCHLPCSCGSNTARPEASYCRGVLHPDQ